MRNEALSRFSFGAEFHIVEAPTYIQNICMDNENLILYRIKVVFKGMTHILDNNSPQGQEEMSPMAGHAIIVHYGISCTFL